MRSVFYLILTLCLSLAAPLAADENMLPDAILDPGAEPGHILVVDKTEQILYLYSHENRRVRLERVMSCSTGANLGDKIVEGDKKTPNGYYIFNQKLLPSELSPIYGTLAYPTDYPNFWDKSISRGGYGIWLHGINKPLVDYDSNGCIELENADIAKMEELINLYSTPLLTYESLSRKPAEDLAAEAGAIKTFVENWRAAWVNKDQAAYQAMYDKDFVNTDRRPYAAWMANKRRLAEMYNTISVTIENIKIFRHRDVVVVVFNQDYRGDSHFTSIGQKRLYLKNVENSYKIVGEEFSPSPDTTTNKWLTAEQKRLALETPPLTVVAQLDPQALGVEAEEARAAAEAKAAAASPAPEKMPEEETTLLAKAETEALAREEARVKAEAEAKALAAEAEVKAKAEAEAKALAEAEVKAKAEAEAKALAEAKAEAEAEALAAAKDHLTALVYAWALAWSTQDTERYFAFYHPDFYYEDKNMFLENFKTYRRPLIEKAQTLDVGVSDFRVEFDNESATVSFRQDYRSDDWRDIGRKTLTLKKDDGSWKITAETWQPLS